MLPKIAALFLIILTLSINSAAALAAPNGLKSYINTTDGYQFLYPNGWLPVKVTGGANIVFRDLIQPTENVSVVISPVSDHKTLIDLGTPGEVGVKLSKSAIAPPQSGRSAELISAEAYQRADKTYYILEYAVKLANQNRHNLASVAVSRGKLLTFNISTTQKRWEKLNSLFRLVVKSFSVD